MANLRLENTQPGSADIVIPLPELPRRLAARASSRANPTIGTQEEGTSQPSFLSHVDEIMFEPSNSTNVNDRADGDGEEGNTMEMAFQSYLNDIAGMPGLTPSGGSWPTRTETRQMSNPSVPHQADTTSNANQGAVNQRSPGLQERYTITMYPEIQLIPIDLQAVANLPGIVRLPGMVVPSGGLFGNRSGRTGSAINANVSVTGDNSTPAVRRTEPSAAHNARPSDQLPPPSNEQPNSAQPSSATAARSTTAAGPRRLSAFPTFIAAMLRSAFSGSASANNATDTHSRSTSENVVPSVTTTHVPTTILNPQSRQQHSSTTRQNNLTTTSTTTTTTANGGPSRHVHSSRSPSTNHERESSMTTARSDTPHGQDLGSLDQFSSVIEHLGTLLSGVMRIVNHSGVDSNLRTLADVLLSGPEPSDLERGTTSHLLRRIAQSLTIRDLQRIADGDLVPLQAIRDVINSWIRDDFLRSEPLSEENIHQTAEYLAVAFVNSGDMHEMPMRLTPHSTVSAADIYAMTLNVSRDYFKILVNLVVATDVNHPGPPSTFAPEITIWLRDIVEAWRTELFALFGDDHVEARRVGRHVVAWFLTCNSAPLHDLMYKAALRLLSFLSSNIHSPDRSASAAYGTGISQTSDTGMTTAVSSSSASSTSTHSVGAMTSDRGDDSNIRVRARQDSDDRSNARKKRKPTDVSLCALNA